MRSWTELAAGLREVEMKVEATIGGRLAPSIWIYTQAVICKGQKYMDGFRNQKGYSILEAISWVRTRVQENREWVSVFSVV